MGGYPSEDILKDFYIPDYVLARRLEEVGDVSHVPACPVVVFVNSNSGGRRGGDLIVTYRTLLNKNQVIFVPSPWLNSLVSPFHLIAARTDRAQGI